ncbi:MAG: Slp family lipoprotein [Nitrospira sp.]|nr:Slp family lipoprotein [Nitrospira sp.]MDH4302450.1 Slp family lipoprotein [Nitrospira sp.]MDH5192546.1 Slp family lipoprotein [Nitrospira sp.]
MFHMSVLAPLVGAALMLSACAESIHQVQRDTELLGVPLGLEQEIDATVTFADLKRAPGEYIGRTVMVGGTVIRATRLESGTEVEILQLPTEKDGPLADDRLRSEGRFIAVREQFLDPASLPQGTPITVIGTVKGETTRALDESEYTYPILEVKHIIDWNSIASQRRRDRSPYYGSYYPPYGYSGFYPYGGFWGPYGGYWGGRGFYGRPYFGGGGGFSPSPSPPPPARVHPRMRGR